MEVKVTNLTYLTKLLEIANTGEEVEITFKDPRTSPLIGRIKEMGDDYILFWSEASFESKPVKKSESSSSEEPQIELYDLENLIHFSDIQVFTSLHKKK